MSVESNKRRRLLREAVRRGALQVKNALAATERAVRHQLKTCLNPIAVEMAVLEAQMYIIMPDPKATVAHFKRTGRW